jgi:hypothetical protein
MGVRRITMGIDGVNGLSKGTSYDDSDVDGMKGKESLSTNTLINRVGNHAGLSQTHNIQGYDKTSTQLVAEHREAQQDKWIEELVSILPGADTLVAAAKMREELKHGEVGKAMLEGGTHIAEEKVKEFLEEQLQHAGYKTAGLAIKIPLTIAKLGMAMATSVAEDGELGQERKEAIVKSAMHITILGSLSGLPQGYVDAARSHYLEDKDAVALANKMNAGGRDNALMATLQLHADQGMGAARTMVDSKQSSSDFFRAHPDLLKRYGEDAAFRAGFDGAVYAKAHGQYDDMMKSLDARDARYDAHHVAWRA